MIYSIFEASTQQLHWIPFDHNKIMYIPFLGKILRGSTRILNYLFGTFNMSAGGKPIVSTNHPTCSP
jgi:hypothetical protein